MNISFNNQVADIFRQCAEVLREQAANPFRINAYIHAAQTLESLPTDARDILRERGVTGLTELPAIGRGLAASIDEIITLLRQKAEKLPAGIWVKGFGYNDQRLEEHRHPTRWDLDKATSTHPVFLGRTDGHLAATNSLGLKMAKISKDTPDPNGGRFDRNPKTGEPTGVLRETAQGRVKALIPPYTIGEIKEGLPLPVGGLPLGA